MKHILLPLLSNTASARNFLYGFCKYAQTRQDWTFEILREDDLKHPTIMQRIRNGVYDGIVTNERTFLAHGELAEIEKTALVINATYDANVRKAGNNLVFVQHNNRVTGRFAASYLLKLGKFASHAYIPTFPPEPWSEERGVGFADYLNKHRTKCFIHNTEESIADFLRSLPKPAAIFAACDRVALGVLETCRSLKIDVPGKIAVLGVDNDEIICEFARPSLTTIIHFPEHSLGEKAGEAMNSLLRKKCFDPPGLLEFNQLKVIERESCVHLPQATYIAHAAMEFISKNAHRALKVNDVVKHLGVSRRLADKQFGQTHGESILRAITRHRLTVVSKRLLISRLPIVKIASLYGFDDLAYLGKIFKRQFGCTMSEWRIKSTSLPPEIPQSSCRWKNKGKLGKHLGAAPQKSSNFAH